jgi:hypothetical protein
MSEKKELKFPIVKQSLVVPQQPVLRPSNRRILPFSLSDSEVLRKHVPAKTRPNSPVVKMSASDAAITRILARQANIARMIAYDKLLSDGKAPQTARQERKKAWSVDVIHPSFTDDITEPIGTFRVSKEKATSSKQFEQFVEPPGIVNS